MKYGFLTALIFTVNLMHAQLFESQLTNSNAAYTAMQDEHFADFSFSALGLPRLMNFINSNASYQHNLENINSGIGIMMGYTHIKLQDDKFTAFHTSFSYRYAHRFENGLRLSGGARFGVNQLRFPENSDVDRLFGLMVGIGAMASYKKFTFGIGMPGMFNQSTSLAINGSYKTHINERIELTAFSGSYFGSESFEQNLTLKAEFNQKFWLATRLIFDYNRRFYHTHLATGLHFGCRIKERFHVFGGTDFGFSSNSFSVYNPRVGLVYQINGSR